MKYMAQREDNVVKLAATVLLFFVLACVLLQLAGCKKPDAPPANAGGGRISKITYDAKYDKTYVSMHNGAFFIVNGAVSGLRVGGCYSALKHDRTWNEYEFTTRPCEYGE